MNAEPLTEAKLNFINEILLKYGNDDAVLDVSDVDDFLTAIASGPESVMPSRWFPELWGGEGKLLFRLCHFVARLLSLHLPVRQGLDYHCRNTTATLSTRKGVAQPWRFFYACWRGCRA
jgi:hypothetical protein